MVRILIRNWLLVIVAAFCLSAEGCMSDAIELPANATPTSLLSVQIAPSVVTDEPVSKIQPTSTLVPDISTPLPIKEGWERIDELLATNGNCRLPCFWGITPGKSLRADLEGVLLLFVKNAKHYNFDYPDLGGMSWVKETNELVVNFGLSYWGQKGKPVGILAFRAEAIDIRDGLDSARLTYDSLIFNQQFREYMLPQILTDYGPPDEVYVLTYAGSTVPNLAQPSFYLYLLYPEQGIFIKYTAPWGREGEYVVGCPATAHMELWLLPPGTEDYAGKLRGDWESLFGAERIYYKTIEETAGMTPEQFYQTFKGGDRAVCLRTPAELWPEIVQ